MMHGAWCLQARGPRTCDLCMPYSCSYVCEGWPSAGVASRRFVRCRSSCTPTSSAARARPPPPRDSARCAPRTTCCRMPSGARSTTCTAWRLSMTGSPGGPRCMGFAAQHTHGVSPDTQGCSPAHARLQAARRGLPHGAVGEPARAVHGGRPLAHHQAARRVQGVQARARTRHAPLPQLRPVSERGARRAAYVYV